MAGVDMRNTDLTPQCFDLQQLNGPNVNNAPQAVIASEEMRRRPVYSKELGEFFTSLREAHGWNQSEAAEFAHRRGHKPLTRQVLLRLERGQTKNPEPDVLRAVGKLYGISYPRIVAAVMKCRYNIDVADRAVANTRTDLESGHAVPVQRGGGGEDARDVIPTERVSDALAEENLTTHAERLIQIAGAIIGTSKLGNELEQLALSLVSGHPSTTGRLSARKAAAARTTRKGVRRTRSSGIGK